MRFVLCKTEMPRHDIAYNFACFIAIFCIKKICCSRYSCLRKKKKVFNAFYQHADLHATQAPASVYIYCANVCLYVYLRKFLMAAYRRIQGMPPHPGFNELYASFDSAPLAFIQSLSSTFCLSANNIFFTKAVVLPL